MTIHYLVLNQYLKSVNKTMVVVSPLFLIFKNLDLNRLLYLLKLIFNSLFRLNALHTQIQTRVELKTYENSLREISKRFDSILNVLIK